MGCWTCSWGVLRVGKVHSQSVIRHETLIGSLHDESRVPKSEVILYPSKYTKAKGPGMRSALARLQDSSFLLKLQFVYRVQKTGCFSRASGSTHTTHCRHGVHDQGDCWSQDKNRRSFLVRFFSRVPWEEEILERSHRRTSPQ